MRFGDRVGKGIRTAPRDALLADSSDADHRGLAFGLHRAGDTAGALIGLLIALGVVWLAQGAGLSLQQATFRSLVLISIIPAALAVVVLAVGARETGAGAEIRPPDVAFRGLALPFRRFVWVVVLFTLGNSADAFLVLRAQERGLSVVSVLAMLATFNLIYALVSGPAGALSDRVGRRRLMVGGWLLYSLLYLGFALVQAAWQVWTLYALYGVYYGVVEGTARAYVADLVHPDRRGTAYGLFNAAVGVAAFPASLIAGALWQGIGRWSGFGPAAPFLFGAGLALAATALLVGWVPDPARLAG